MMPVLLLVKTSINYLCDPKELYSLIIHLTRAKIKKTDKIMTLPCRFYPEVLDAFFSKAENLNIIHKCKKPFVLVENTLCAARNYIKLMGIKLLTEDVSCKNNRRFYKNTTYRE
jgi:hypothetical protein